MHPSKPCINTITPIMNGILMLFSMPWNNSTFVAYDGYFIVMSDHDYAENNQNDSYQYVIFHLINKQALFYALGQTIPNTKTFS